MVRAIVGANWGDEGKGKVTDFLAKDAAVVVRFQGGANAGHTIINDHGKFSLHLLPSGIFNPDTINVIGNGVALNVDDLRKEKESVNARGVDFQLRVSDRAQIMLPHHVLLDVYEEERLSDRKFGSTKSGIAPFYADKYAHIGLQVWQLYDDPDLRKRVEDVCMKVNILLEHLYHKPIIDVDELLEHLRGQAEWLRPYVTDTTLLLHNAIEEDKTVLMEGQLGTLRDIDHGIYPYVTSSSTLAGFSLVGAGCPASELKEVVAVVKAYSSSVGEGPFAVELSGSEAEELRRRGGDAGEYGAKTGRPRRVGWFDSVATRYGCRMQGATCAALTNLDVLGYLPEIPVCVGYEIDGKACDIFPTTAKIYRAKPIFETLPGWMCDIRGERVFANLPENAVNYIRFLQKQIRTPIRYVSTGPEREAFIDIQGLS